MKGELPSEGLPTLSKLSPLQFACNTPLRGTIQDKFEVHVTSVASNHLRNIDTSNQKVSREEDDDSHVVRSRKVVFAPTAIARVIL